MFTVRWYRPWIVLCCATLSGCASIPLPGTGGKTLERKAVIGTHEPDELVAEDQTRCRATSEKLARTRVGQKVWCLWR
jgi:hypothetical protein